MLGYYIWWMLFVNKTEKPAIHGPKQDPGSFNQYSCMQVTSETAFLSI